MSKHYFISDVHLGSKIISNPQEHELLFITWLKNASQDAKGIYLLGDIFDFWFEFPFGKIQTEYNAVLSTIKDITAKGVEVHFFCGNHDQWTYGHLEKHCGMIIHKKNAIINIDNKKFFLAHGHGIGKQKTATKILNWVFESKITQIPFRYLVPAKWAWKFGKNWSAGNRKKHDNHEAKFQGENKENQVIFTKNHSAENPDIDFYIMGHRHIELNLMLATGAQIMILGNFYSLFTYAVWDGQYLMMMNEEA